MPPPIPVPKLVLNPVGLGCRGLKPPLLLPNDGLKPVGLVDRMGVELKGDELPKVPKAPVG
jgi:hypothetical protein